MLTTQQKNVLLESMVKILELPDSAYEKAKNRYEDLGEWFGRDDSTLKDNDPHIFPQGSFRLGTAIKPLSEDEEYDLDLGCKLKKGVRKESHTQYDLKTMIGKELDAYRIARRIKTPIEEKHRCWRLEYQDEMSFHMDIVPCIPLNDIQRGYLYESIRSAGIDSEIVEQVSESSISITDDRDEKYDEISGDWNISNPEGYAQWFVFKMKRREGGILMERAQVDDVPDYRVKSPLQRVIQLLKRHRDNMFKDNEDIKPISIIITTLATRAYNGEKDIESALANILLNMGDFVNPTVPRVENPVNPAEDFADRWSMEQYGHLKLERNFWQWLEQAQHDFGQITSSVNSEFIAEQIMNKFSLRINKEALAASIGLMTTASVKSKEYILEEENTTSPWRCEE